MPIYHLSERDDEPERVESLFESVARDSPWERWAKVNNAYYLEYGDVRDFVVVACSDAEARAIAVAEDKNSPCRKRWLDGDATSCTEIDPNGRARVVVGNWPTG